MQLIKTFSKYLGLFIVATVVSSCSQNDNLYVIETEIGDIVFEVYPEKAPITVANFLKYVELADFDSANFYRSVRMDNQPKDSVKIEVIQGNFTARSKSFGTIPHETTDKIGLLHKDGTMSMGRLKPGSAALVFFICINDQPELDFGGKRYADGLGFAAFGQVTQGMDIVREIQRGETDYQTLIKTIDIHQIRKQ